MKILPIVFVLLLANGASAGDYLKPPLSPFIGVDIVTNYHAQVERTFSKAYSRKTMRDEVKLKCIVTPSFKPEYMVGVKKEGDRFFAFRISAKESIWFKYQSEYLSNGPNHRFDINIKVVEAKAEITKEAFSAAAAPWNEMILATRYSGPLAEGLDGVSYYFIDPDLRIGWAWSPEPGTRKGKLVKLVELLDQLAQGGNPQKTESEILNVAASLKEQLKYAPNH